MGTVNIEIVDGPTEEYLERSRVEGIRVTFTVKRQGRIEKLQATVSTLRPDTVSWRGFEGTGYIWSAIRHYITFFYNPKTKRGCIDRMDVSETGDLFLYA